MSCAAFAADGTAEEGYADEVIRCIEQYGPYIVLIPGVAMPHSQENGPLVHGTGVSFMRLKEPVCFDPEDEDKWADLCAQRHVTKTCWRCQNSMKCDEAPSACAD